MTRAILLLACCAATARADISLRATGPTATDNELRALEAQLEAQPSAPRADELLLALADKLIQRAEADSSAEKIDLRKPIALLDRLIAQYPKSRFRDGGFYLQGYAHGVTGNFKAAKAAFSQLLKEFPQSKYAAESWMRLGEHEFDDGRLDAAIAAYGHILDHPRFRDQALYKTAWALYRAERYDDAAKRFDELVARAPSGGIDLREEAMQYLAICFVDREPQQSGFARARRFYTGRESEPHVRKVYLQVARGLFEVSWLEQATEVATFIQRTWPNTDESLRSARLLHEIRRAAGRE
jgi:tetratricopeptide (TPR) repeat protein